MITEPPIEELLERMNEVHGEDEWQVRITGSRVVVEWGWEDDGDLDNDCGAGLTFTATLRYVTGTTLRHALEIATREWSAIETYGSGSTWGWCCRLCRREVPPTLVTQLLAEVKGAHHLDIECTGRPTPEADA